MSSWPELPVSWHALSLCTQMFAAYYSWRWLHTIERNMLAALVALMLTIFNVGMVGYSFWTWYGSELLR